MHRHIAKGNDFEHAFNRASGRAGGRLAPAAPPWSAWQCAALALSLLAGGRIHAATDEPCCTSHAGIGCADPACNGIVCQLDPFCCASSWDERCASEASVLCDACRPTGACEMPVADDEESPVPGGDHLGFCPWPPSIRTLSPGVLHGGRAWASATARDVDWFEISLDKPQLLRIELWTAGPIGVVIVDGACPPTAFAEGVDGCASVTEACLPAGVARVAVRSILFDELALEDDRSRYVLRASVSPCTPELPVHDRCDTALPVDVGRIVVDTRHATTEATWLPTTCDEGAGLAFTHDVWYAFTAREAGVFRVGTCATPAFDSRIAVYTGCGGDLLACSDDSCDGDAASAEFPMRCGETALIRVGGWGMGGLITLDLERVSTVACPCVGDIDASGEVDSGDLGICLLEFGSQGGPADLNEDGCVDAGDLGLLLLFFGKCDSWV